MIATCVLLKQNDRILKNLDSDPVSSGGENARAFELAFWTCSMVWKSFNPLIHFLWTKEFVTLCPF